MQRTVATYWSNAIYLSTLVLVMSNSMFPCSSSPGDPNGDTTCCNGWGRQLPVVYAPSNLEC
eukprot:scaffold291767_cov28-Tisochrysis_lutea.AAC.2